MSDWSDGFDIFNDPGSGFNWNPDDPIGGGYGPGYGDNPYPPDPNNPPDPGFNTPPSQEPQGPPVPGGLPPGGGIGSGGLPPPGSVPGNVNNPNTPNPNNQNNRNLMGIGQFLAMVQYLRDSTNYQKMAQQGIQYADPFASQRGQYQQQLSSLMADPSQIANTPGYKFALSQGLNSVNNQDNSRFGVGAGSTDVDRMNYAEGLASQTYQDQVKNLTQLSGGNFAPTGAGALWQTGMFASANARDAAMRALNTGMGNLGSTGFDPNNPGSTFGDFYNWITGGNQGQNGTGQQQIQGPPNPYPVDSSGNIIQDNPGGSGPGSNPSLTPNNPEPMQSLQYSVPPSQVQPFNPQQSPLSTTGSNLARGQ